MPELKGVASGATGPDGNPRRAAAGDDETLSALMDDGAQDLELRRLLRELEAEPELAERWYRYHLARGAMAGEAVFDAPDFSAQVRAAIAEEPELSSTGGGWRRALGSFAVAASVTMAVVLGGQQLALVTAPDGAAAERVAPLPVGVVNTTGAVPVRASFGTGAVPTLQPADRTAYRELARQRLRLYSQEHAEHASLNTPLGMVPFARVPVIQE